MTILLITTISVVVAMILLSGFATARTCPKCNEPLPQRRKPASRRQMLWGGWTCRRCGCELDRKGREMQR